MMMRKQETFNAAADDILNSNAEARAARRKRNGQITDYADATPEDKEKMHAKFSAIDRDPGDYAALIAYGTAPIQELEKMADEVLKLESQMNDQVKTVVIITDKMDQSFASIGIEGIVKGVKSMVKGAGDGLVAGGKGIGNFSKKIWNAMSGAEKKRTEEEAQVQQMIDRLPEMAKEMKKLSIALVEAEEGIKQLMAAAKKLGEARVEAARELAIYLGAAPEVLRRYDEIYIPEAKKAYDESGDPEDQNILEEVVRGKETFSRQYSMLMSAHGRLIGAATLLRDTMEQLENQRRIIEQARTIRQGEWKDMLSGASIVASSLKIAQLIKKSDEMGDKAHKLTDDMIDKAHDMTLSSQGRGTVDPKLVLESMDRAQKRLEKAQSVREAHMRELESSREQIRAKAQALLDATDKAKDVRVLESSKKVKQDALEPKNDNQSPAAVDGQEKVDSAAPKAEIPPRP